MDRCNGDDCDVQPYRLNTLDNGLMVPPFVTQKMIDDLRWLPLREQDVFVVTFPKSGTTWMQQVVKLIHGNGEDNDQNIVEAAPWIESVGNKGVKVILMHFTSTCKQTQHIVRNAVLIYSVPHEESELMLGMHDVTSIATIHFT